MEFCAGEVVDGREFVGKDVGDDEEEVEVIGMALC